MDLQLIFGIIGNILSVYFGLKILQTYKNNRLTVINKINEYLFFIMFFNTFNWLFYSIVLRDIFIFINNVVPIFGNFGMILVCYSRIEESRKIYIEIISGLFISYFIIMTFLFNFTLISYKNLSFVFGIGAVLTSILSYLSPILIIREVIETRNHKIIYLPQVLLGLITMIIFLIYGLVINNIFIIIVDAIIIFICLVQLLVYCYYKYMVKSNNKSLDKQNDKNIELVDIKPESNILVITKNKEFEIIV